MHTFEVDGDNVICICNHCHDNGNRFCLISHQVEHIGNLVPIFDDMYVLPGHQVNPEVLSQVDDIDDYLHNVGIENPCPNYEYIDFEDS